MKQMRMYTPTPPATVKKVSADWPMTALKALSSPGLQEFGLGISTILGNVWDFRLIQLTHNQFLSTFYFLCAESEIVKDPPRI